MPNTSFKELLSPWYPDAPDVSISGITLDHRELKPGDVFIAIQGHVVDGRRFIADAIKAGACAVIADGGESGDNTSSAFDSGIPVITLPYLKSCLSEIAARFYQSPSSRLRVVGITGTNGKTTISQLLSQWLNLLGKKSAVMGTAGNGFLDALKPAANTTGSALDIQKNLADFHQQQATHVAMEVSSHGLVQGRVSAVNFDAAVFTNLSRDHLEYHGTMEAYAEAKLMLFTHYGCPVSVINADDSVGQQWLKNMPEAIAVGNSQAAVSQHQGKKLWLTDAQYSPHGVEVAFDSEWGAGKFNAALVGPFNVSNLLLSLATLLGMGYPLDDLLIAAGKLVAVCGRMEVFSREKLPLIVVDYAHTPDALEKALDASRRHTKGQLWCICGCGGDRDTGKRPMMAEIAEQMADHVILTDDNPRSESPVQIINDMLSGMTAPDNANVLHDRREAMTFAFEKAGPDDVILVAGKGHEDYQVLASGKIHYSDRETAQALLEAGQ
ncbi:UDP-N-acetylmuramoyl-L-alanyl-D-glutamate--2,6-diaminopimelate ligase [Veronia pacifica]|uniref:UDP-N-acetylmuramoyl-L-alanyl-D-glutamate--2,6-diaminopimelate ligase n=1 Tax=Veronia pacifica TaxID=1080227 RepID=A0A1C3ELI3_9GAMM|nr:UDP-N-acetylmuramoyl-L-alanyl-D-glutamate--2,6-diaminopimelate ligase [Veronia pacifica]ODA34092.1 UDP-N-acetylmuramoyl-L-alanyl-D-glutamate--2,6-diaminopimelate ligase [Veronia pacifica]